MAIKVIAQLREVKLGKNPGKKFVMRPDLYVPIAEKKVFQEAATHSGISAGVIKAAWDAAGEVIRTWATEGHSIPLPGLGTMRFGVRSKAVEKLEDVKANLISVRITCLDEDGNVLKRVTSGDSGDIEDTENTENGSSQSEATNGSSAGTENGGGSGSGSGSNTGGNTSGDNNGGNTGGGGDGGDDLDKN